jgi:hypothetical protein
MPNDSTVTLKETDDEDILLELPDDILEAVGWTEGDTLNVEVIGSRIVLTRVPGGPTED